MKSLNSFTRADSRSQILDLFIRWRRARRTRCRLTSVFGDDMRRDPASVKAKRTHAGDLT